MIHKMNPSVKRHGNAFEGPRGCSIAGDSELSGMGHCSDMVLAGTGLTVY